MPIKSSEFPVLVWHPVLLLLLYECSTFLRYVEPLYRLVECFPYFQVPSVHHTATRTSTGSSRTNALCCLTLCWKTTRLSTRQESRSPSSQRAMIHPATQKPSPRFAIVLGLVAKVSCFNSTHNCWCSDCCRDLCELAVMIVLSFCVIQRWCSRTNTFTEQETRMQQPRDPCSLGSWAWPLEARPHGQEYRHQSGDELFSWLSGGGFFVNVCAKHKVGLITHNQMQTFRCELICK